MWGYNIWYIIDKLNISLLYDWKFRIFIIAILLFVFFHFFKSKTKNSWKLDYDLWSRLENSNDSKETKIFEIKLKNVLPEKWKKYQKELFIINKWFNRRWFNVYWIHKNWTRFDEMW